MKRWFLNAFSLLSIVSILLPACRPEGERIFKKSEFLMDTVVTVTVVAESEERAKNAMNAAFSELKELEHILNFFAADSEVAEINKNASIKPVKVSPDTLEVISKAVEISEKTEGAFDISVGVITRLYDFNNKTRPGDDQIRRTLPLVGYKNIVVDRSDMTVFLKKRGMMIDPGGITKGYAADRAVEVLKSEGIRAALVSVSGDIRGYGLRPDGKPWRIGVRDPDGKDNAVIATLDLTDMAISTSGNYERFFIQDGIRYHHIIDPGTGYPAGGMTSVTVIAPLGVYTDSLATALFISGVDEGLKIASGLGYEAFMIDSEGRIFMSDTLRGRLELIKKDN